MPPRKRSAPDDDEDAFVSEYEGDGDEDFRIHNALKPSRATTYTAQALYDMMLAGDVILDPEYQRDIVWTKDKQTRIIDSILRNFYVPPVIFASSMQEDGGELKTCIDGKQRLTSIRLFMDGVIPLIDSETNLRLFYKLPPGDTRKKLLPERYRRLFAAKQIVCVEYSDLSGQNERDIFQRVQLGVALTPSEKLQAIDSARGRFVRELVTDDAVQGLVFDKTRAGDFRVLAHVVCTIENWSQGAPKHMHDRATLEKWLLLQTDISPNMQEEIRVTKDVVCGMGLKGSGKFKRISPVELVVIFVFTHVRRLEGYSESNLRMAVASMRTAFKDAHTELKMNTRCTTWAFGYITNRTANLKSPGRRSEKKIRLDDEDLEYI